jgi:hypothetical protein
MILTFKPNFLSGRPTNFVEKIWASKTSPKAFHTMSMMDAMYENIEATPASKTGRYKPEFCIDELRPKLHTIRKDEKNRWKVGKIIHFTLFNRTKDHWNFFTTKCTGVQRVFMVIYPLSGELNDKNLIYLLQVEDNLLSDLEMEELATNEGFDNVDAFIEWFRPLLTPSEVAEFKLIHWTDTRY